MLSPCIPFAAPSKKGTAFRTLEQPLSWPARGLAQPVAAEQQQVAVQAHVGAIEEELEAPLGRRPEPRRDEAHNVGVLHRKRDAGQRHSGVQADQLRAVRAPLEGVDIGVGQADVRSIDPYRPFVVGRVAKLSYLAPTRRQLDRYERIFMESQRVPRTDL